MQNNSENYNYGSPSGYYFYFLNQAGYSNGFGAYCQNFDSTITENIIIGTQNQSFNYNGSENVSSPTNNTNQNCQSLQNASNQEENSELFKNISEQNVPDIEPQARLKKVNRQDSQNSYSSDQFDPADLVESRKHQGKSKGRNFQEKPKRKKVRSWSEVQNHKYFSFIKENAISFRTDYKERTKLKINVLMSRRVRTKNSVQCHNHHQKMLKKHGGVQKLISFIEEEKQRATNATNAREISERECEPDVENKNVQAIEQ